MNENDWLAKQFQENRERLRAIAFRMLGAESEAEDAVQESWIRLTNADTDAIENLGGWLTTVVSRVCLDALRARKSRAQTLHKEEAERADEIDSHDPETALFVADAIGPALLMVLETLTASERVAFVLHDLFDLSFEEIAPILGRSVPAARQLASRARRQIRGNAPQQADMERQQQVVSAFLTASREGDFTALLQLLHPDVVLCADEMAIKITRANQAKGAPQFEREMKGAQQVAKTFKVGAVQLALLDGFIGAIWGPAGKPVVAYRFALEDDAISAIEVVMEKQTLQQLNIELLDETKETNP